MFDKELLSKRYEKYMQIKFFKKAVNRMEEKKRFNDISQEPIQMAKKLIEGHTTSIVITEIQIKTTMA